MNDTMWMVSPPRPEAETLSAELGIPLEIARVLANRNILDVPAAREFLSGGLDGLHDPYLKPIRRVFRILERVVLR